MKTDNQPEAPKKFKKIIEKAMNRDRITFERNPQITSYIRDYVPGECWPLVVSRNATIEVTQIVPGVRTRQIRDARPDNIDIEQWAKLHGKDMRIAIFDEDGTFIGEAWS